MCEAIEGLINDARAEGIQKGIQEGIQKGKEEMCEAIEGLINDARAEGMQKGIQNGKIITAIELLASLVKDNILTVTEATKRANMSVTEFEVKMNAL